MNGGGRAPFECLRANGVERGGEPFVVSHTPVRSGALEP